jgi:hypothetical protein
MEPFWNYARINQVKTRAIRFRSHTDLPIEDRNVQTYIYLSDYPKDYPEEKKTEYTTDVELYEKSINNMKLIDKFMLSLAESSIDCSIHYPNLTDKVKENINCKLCTPNNMKLYENSIKKDMLVPSNCVPFKENKIKVKEIVYNNNKFYYDDSTDELKIYAFNNKINGMKQLKLGEENYSEIINILLSEKYNTQINIE